MYLKVKKAKLIKNSFWKNDIFINMVAIYNDEWKFIKFVKITEQLLDKILTETIQLSDWYIIE